MRIVGGGSLSLVLARVSSMTPSVRAMPYEAISYKSVTTRHKNKRSQSRAEGPSHKTERTHEEPEDDDGQADEDGEEEGGVGDLGDP